MCRIYHTCISHWLICLSNIPFEFTLQFTFAASTVCCVKLKRQSFTTRRVAVHNSLSETRNAQNLTAISNFLLHFNARRQSCGIGEDKQISDLNQRRISTCNAKNIFQALRFHEERSSLFVTRKNHKHKIGSLVLLFSATLNNSCWCWNASKRTSMGKGTVNVCFVQNYKCKRYAIFSRSGTSCLVNA